MTAQDLWMMSFGIVLGNIAGAAIALILVQDLWMMSFGIVLGNIAGAAIVLILIKVFLK